MAANLTREGAWTQKDVIVASGQPVQRVRSLVRAGLLEAPFSWADAIVARLLVEMAANRRTNVSEPLQGGRQDAALALRDTAAATTVRAMLRDLPPAPDLTALRTVTLVLAGSRVELNRDVDLYGVTGVMRDALPRGAVVSVFPVGAWAADLLAQLGHVADRPGVAA